MTTTATVFDWEDFPSEIQNYFEDCVDMVTNNCNDTFLNFPLDWDVHTFGFVLEDCGFPTFIDSYLEVVTYLKANMVAGTELAIVN